MIACHGCGRLASLSRCIMLASIQQCIRSVQACLQLLICRGTCRSAVRQQGCCGDALLCPKVACMQALLHAHCA